MKIGMIGHGVVGQATANGLARKNNSVVIYDKYKEGLDSIEEVCKCEIIFICVPTPMKKSGEINLDAINESIKQIDVFANDGTIVVIKSTATSGTTEDLADQYPKLNFAFNPEFLTEKNATEDFLNSDRVIIGTRDKDTFARIALVYREAGFECPIIHANIRTAEIIKEFTNVFLASKVMIANEFFRICEKLNINYNEAIEIVQMDQRIGKSHWQVPGHDGDFGFGSKCFPKDINALIYLAREKGYRPYVLEEVWKSNLNVRKKIDWLDQITDGGAE